MTTSFEFKPNPDFPDEFAEMLKKAALAKAKEHTDQILGSNTPVNFSTDELEVDAKRIATEMQDKFRKLD
jgi:hypothetical protein